MAKTKRNRSEYNAYMRQYMREYLAAHPDKRKEYAITKAINLLRENGYIVTRGGGSRDE
mgnify:CR=1 FL=1